MRYLTPRLSSPGLSGSPRKKGLLAMLLCALATGCGTTEPVVGEHESLGTQSSEVVSTNGLSTNGLSTNGLSTNGLSTNGLSTNGLSTNGLSTNGLFSTWFAEDTARGNQVMKYIAFCALPSGQSLSYTYNGVTYKPLTTRIRTQDVFKCGDGLCQFTERCGSGNTASSCASDCGTCQ